MSPKADAGPSTKLSDIDMRYKGTGTDLCHTCHTPTIDHPVGVQCDKPRCCRSRLSHYEGSPEYISRLERRRLEYNARKRATYVRNKEKK